jgi:3-dehydroquinate synthase
VLARIADFVPARGGKVFVATTRMFGNCTAARSQRAWQAGHFNRYFSPEASPPNASNMWKRWPRKWFHAGADRSSIVIAFGGGIATDMGAFLASIFMRGIPSFRSHHAARASGRRDRRQSWRQSACRENLIGTFHQPLAVLVDPEVLRTLPERDFRAGLFEVVKYGSFPAPSYSSY